MYRISLKTAFNLVYELLLNISIRQKKSPDGKNVNFFMLLFLLFHLFSHLFLNSMFGTNIGAIFQLLTGKKFHASEKCGTESFNYISG